MTWMRRSRAWCSQFGPYVSEPYVQLRRTPELGELRKDELNGLLPAFVGCVPFQDLRRFPEIPKLRTVTSLHASENEWFSPIPRSEPRGRGASRFCS